MAWIEGVKHRDPKENINEQILEIDHFANDEECRYWACRFIEHNLDFAARMILGLDGLFEFQEIMLKMMFKRERCLFIVARGGAKTWLGAVFAALYSIFNPGSTIVVVSMSFRQARKIFEKLEEITSNPKAVLYRQCCEGGVKKYTYYWQQTYKNGSRIIALPLGGGGMLRGERAERVICDELLGINEKILNEVIGPFLSTNTKETKLRTDIVKMEQKLVKEGKLKREEMTKFPSNGFIGLSSATFQFEYLYKLFEQYKKNVNDEKVEGDYGVCQLSYEVMPPGYYDAGTIEDAKNTMSDLQFQKEYGAQFPDESGGFFNIKKLRECLAEKGQAPYFEVLGYDKAKYILAIDPAFAEGDNHDDFAMSVYKIVDMKKRKIQLVHSYARPGRPLKEHYEYFMYLIQNFNIVYLMIDSGGGGETFYRGILESEIFKNYDKPLEVFNKNISLNNRLEMIQEMKEAYCYETGHIVHLQNFTAWASMANYELQQSIDRRRILFPSMPVDEQLQRMDTIVKDNELHRLPFWRKKDEFSQTPTDFIDNQELLVELTINQTAFIEPKNTGAGQRFDLPQWLLKDKGPNRQRKDCYSALLMANWAAGCYFDMMSTEDEFQTAKPIFLSF